MLANISGKDKTIWLMLFVVGLSPIAMDRALDAFSRQWRWMHHPVHALVEGGGSLIAMIVSLTILALRKEGHGVPGLIWVASALMCMGVLDGFHAAAHAGRSFVWLHSIATFFGGLFFACIWLPEKWARHPRMHYVPIATLVLGIFLGIFSTASPEALPAMTDAEGFTIAAKALNLLGAVGFFAATVYFIHNRHRDLKESVLFANHCLLFGVASVLFERSVLWDASWWLWHFLRLAAYLVVLYFFFQLYREALARAREASAALESKVEERTRELTAEVAARIQVEDALREREARLAYSNAELEQFAYVASHDLQEPLRMISSYLELLTQRYQEKLDDKANHWIGLAVDGSARMKLLINDLLELSRVSTEAKPFRPLDLTEIFKTAQANLQQAIRETGAVITHGILPTVRGDATQMTQLFQNLIGNAIKYRNEQTPEVRIEACLEGASWRIAVRDNGIGIDPQFHERVFIVFQRLHTRMEYAGTGIGLALCKKIVERHGGRIWIESQLGQGATFFFTIPNRKETVA